MSQPDLQRTLSKPVANMRRAGRTAPGSEPCQMCKTGGRAPLTRSPVHAAQRIVMSLTFIRSAAGAALLTVLAAGCGTAMTAQHAGAKPAAAAQPHYSAPAQAPVTTPPSPPSTTAPA